MTYEEMFPALFEQRTSPLYYSDDTRLDVYEVTADDDAFRTFQVRYVPTLEVVLTTHERVLADAYIAGYDLATSVYTRPGRRA